LVAFAIGKIRDDGGDAACAGPLEGIDVEEQLDEVIVDGIGKRLDEEDILAANVFENADEGIALGEVLGIALAGSDAEFVTDGGGEDGAGGAGEDEEFVASGHVGSCTGTKERSYRVKWFPGGER